MVTNKSDTFDIGGKRTIHRLGYESYWKLERLDRLSTRLQRYTTRRGIRSHSRGCSNTRLWHCRFPAHRVRNTSKRILLRQQSNWMHRHMIGW